MKFPLTIIYPCGEDSDLINVVDAADNCLFGEAGCLPNHSNNLRANWQELVRRANAYDALLATLQNTESCLSGLANSELSIDSDHNRTEHRLGIRDHVWRQTERARAVIESCAKSSPSVPVSA